MKKIVIIAIVAFSIGSLSLLTNKQCEECAPAVTKTALVVLNDHNVLATAD